MDKTYNGWTNYETWNVKLWIDNEEGSSHYWADRARSIYRRARADRYNTQKEAASFPLREQLKDEFENQGQDALEAAGVQSSWIADIFGAALSEVNWQEIAEALLEDCGSEEEETTEESEATQ